MQPTESPIPVEIDKKSSPFNPRNLFDLLFRPYRFFVRFHTIEHSPYVYICAWLHGVALVFPLVDSFARQSTPTSADMWRLFSQSWLAFWLLGLAGGLLNALGTWFINAWWYWLRLSWSSYEKPDGFQARLIFYYSSLAVVLPFLLSYVIFTIVFPNYGAAHATPRQYLLLGMFLPFWSFGISYVGIRTSFKTKEWPSRLWFLILPTILQVVGIVMGFCRTI